MRLSSYWAGRLLDLRYELEGIRRRLTAWVPPATIVRERIAYRSLRAAPGNWPPTRWWWLARKEWDRNCLVTWRSRIWWQQQRRDLVRACYWEPMLWVGLYDLTEGGWFKDAVWSWPWKARAPGWRVPTRTIYTWPIYGEYQLRVLSSREPVTFRKATG